MIHSFITNHPRTTLGVVSFMTFVNIIIQVNTGACLKTPTTPGGILSLEMVWQQSDADTVRAAWPKNCHHVQPLCDEQASEHPIINNAFSNIKWDFAFILTYVALLYTLVILHGSQFSKVTHPPYTKMFCAVSVAAGFFDCMENIQMLRFLTGSVIVPWTIGLMAASKFLALTLIILYLIWRGAYLKRFSAFTLALAHILWANRVSVTGLLVLYFTLWKSDQGQDLLINLNASHWGPTTFYIILCIMATFYWYWPKFFTDPRWEAADQLPNVGVRNLFFGDWNPRYESFEASYVPRLLGVLTFIIPACGILQALNIFEIPYLLNFLDPFAFLIVTIIIFILIMENHILEFFFAFAPRLYWAVIMCLATGVVGLGFFNKYSPNQLSLLTIGLYAIAGLFVMLTTIRRVPEFYQGSLMVRLRHMKANTPMLCFVFLASIIFFAFNCYPYITADGPYRFITLPVVLTAIVFYSFVFFLLMIWGKKKKINFAAFLIVFAILIAVAFENKYHDIKTVKRELPHTLPTLSSYIHNWILSRKDDILLRDEYYPVFIVNAYGGGIRAAAWTTLSVSMLDSLTQNQFQDHVLAYSGASGGTIGSSVLCAVRRNNSMNRFGTMEVKRFYEHDFLTPVLIGLFGRDVWFSTLGISWFNDRARLQDKIWEHHTREYADDNYQKEFNSLWYPNGNADYTVPLLFSNTYHVEKGLKGIFVPVSIGRDTAQFESTIIINELLGKESMRFSTGAFLSARFPYISPAGKLDDGYHFLDGGLKENSGAETAEEIYRAYLQTASQVKRNAASADFPEISADTVDLLYKKIRIYFLSLNSSIKPPDDPGPSRNLVELTAPFEALFNNWIGNTAKADSILRIRHRDRHFELRPTPMCVDDFKPVLPLGWQISDRALTGMTESLIVPGSQNLRNLEMIHKIIKDKP